MSEINKNQEVDGTAGVRGKNVYIRTLGCQMNVRDSEVICGLLVKGGFEIVDDVDKADVVLFNTCSVRQHAEDKVWSEIGSICKRAAKLKRTQVTVTKGRDSHPRCAEQLGELKEGQVSVTGMRDSHLKPIIGILGCMAQNYKESIFERAPGVDFVVGPSDIHKIPGILEKITNEERRGQSLKGGDSPLLYSPIFSRKIWETEGLIRPEEIYHTGFYEERDHAFVVISEGCSNFCSYCVVPFVRGELHHRNYEDIMKEIEETIGNGISRITLLGQNVNAYVCNVRDRHACPLQGNIDFIKLIEQVNRVPGLKEFSFITSHPKDTSVELFEAMQGLDKLKKYLHLPAQSGSDRILKAMNRGYTSKFYLELARNYRTIVRSAELSTDIIVGFPGETEEDFQDTFNLVKEVRFNSAYIFKYSVRPHTAAARMEDDVPKEEKERRHKLILDLQKEISRSIKAESLRR